SKATSSCDSGRSRGDSTSSIAERPGPTSLAILGEAGTEGARDVIDVGLRDTRPEVKEWTINPPRGAWAVRPACGAPPGRRCRRGSGRDEGGGLRPGRGRA